jgi:aspartyl-tRNA(Asn)/glutamyl-tRNA(Gln) amidotransferase subunit A
MAGFDPEDPTSADREVPDYVGGLTERLDGLRIGYVRHFSEKDAVATDSVHEALEAALRTFATLGAEVRDVALPHLWEFTACNSVILMAEAFTIHERDLQDRPDEYTETTRDRLTLGGAIRAADYLQAQRLRRELAARYRAVTADVDVLVCAGALAPAPTFEAAAEAQKFYLLEKPVVTTPFNLVGAPAIAVCCGFDRGGLPVGMQIAGRHFDETSVLRAAHAYERASSWRSRRPHVVAY